MVICVKAFDDIDSPEQITIVEIAKADFPEISSILSGRVLTAPMMRS